MAYHYPQQPAQAAPNGPRQGLSSLEPVSQSGSEYPAYAATQPPYPPAQQGHAQQRNFGQTGAPDYRQWSAPAPVQDQRGYPGQQVDPLQQQAEWAHPAHFGYGEAAAEEAYQNTQAGYQQPHSSALEQNYSQEETGEYEADEGRRGSWAMRIAGAIVVAIGLGYGLAQGYKLVAGSEPDGATPVVKGDSGPAKTLPVEPGGKQFAHTDSKVMGRLGEAAPSSVSASAELSGADTDASGARKVTTLVVGRDGSINPPAAPAEPASATPSTVAVPGLTVIDGFGGQYPGSVSSSSAPPPEAQAEASPKAPAAEHKPIVVKPPASAAKPEVIAAVKAAPAGLDKAAPVEPAVLTTGATSPAAQKTEAPKETAAIPSSAAPEASGGSNGYVAVLVSVPVSGQSRLVALKKFADMQEKYGSVLQNKTPDVQEANLGDKGSYHRLLVGPPGSRAQASTLCNELKTAGYKDCWVTAY